MIFNVTGGGAGSGGTLVVTAPAGVTCTVSKDGKTKSKTVDQYGYATFKGLDTGTWTVVITDGSKTSPARQVVVTADYDVTMSFFSASIAVTYPEGSTCTCSDGSTTLTAPDTSGSHTFTVPNAGTWKVAVDNNSENVTIAENGESVSVDLTTIYFYNNGTFNDEINHTEKKTPSSAKITYMDDRIQFNTVSGKVCEVYVVFGPIDLTAFATLELTWIVGSPAISSGTTTQTQRCALFSAQSATAGYDKAIAITTVNLGTDTGIDAPTGTVWTVTLDVTEQIGEQYVYAGTNTRGENWNVARYQQVGMVKGVLK